MIAFEPQPQNESRSRKEQVESEERKRNEQCGYAKERYGFQVRFIEDNVIQIEDAHGNEVAFEYPMAHITFEEYDKFIEQMRNTDSLPPSIDNLKMSISRRIGDSRGSHETVNAITSPYTWEQHAQANGIDVQEMKWMYFFAREELYRRFKSRLRKSHK